MFYRIGVRVTNGQRPGQIYPESVKINFEVNKASVHLLIRGPVTVLLELNVKLPEGISADLNGLSRNIITACMSSCGKVIFSIVSLFLFTSRVPK